jgi:hypothetical protein
MNFDDLKINGYDSPFGENEDIFLMDLWSAEEGLLYLIGLKSLTVNDLGDEMHIETLSSEEYRDSLDSELMSDAISKLQRLQKFWFNFPHAPSNSPDYFINWALSKQVEIAWLPYVIEKKYYIPQKDLDTEKSLNSRLENNYLRLILSLCYGIPGFRTTDKPNTIAKLIIETTNIKISQETLAKYIDRAQTNNLSEP